MPIYSIELRGRIEVADRTMAFIWKKPKGFTYRPGQFADFTIHNPLETDARGNTRGFSLASAPSESFLMNATRLRDSAFKRVLQSVPLGTLMTLDAPYGSFLLHDDAAIPAVFLAGGIGITPVRSIVVEATLQRLPHRIYLFHANRGPEAVPFFDSLTALENRNPNFRYIPTMTRPDKSAEKWGGETGYINIPMLNRHLHDLSAPIYYVSGPQVMVLALKKMLLEGGINETNIRTEEFEGYDKAPEPVVTMEKAVA